MALQHIDGTHQRKDGVLVTYMGTYNDGFNPGYAVEAFTDGKLKGTLTGQLTTVDLQVGLEDAIRRLIHAHIDSEAS